MSVSLCRQIDKLSRTASEYPTEGSGVVSCGWAGIRTSAGGASGSVLQPVKLRPSSSHIAGQYLLTFVCFGKCFILGLLESGAFVGGFAGGL